VQRNYDPANHIKLAIKLPTIATDAHPESIVTAALLHIKVPIH
jgi:hypothetical protein